jgi:hypothetical protein
MLELDINKTKNLDFEIQLSGIDYKQLEGSLRILIDGIEYGFKVEVNSSSIIANIPMLKNVLLREVREGEQFEAKLEVHGAGYYLNPWNGSFVVKNPVLMEAKIREDLDDKVPKITAKIKSKSSDKVESKLVEMKKVLKPKINVVITEKHIFDYMKSKGTTSEQVQQLILEQCKGKSKTDNPEDVLRSVVHFYKNKS